MFDQPGITLDDLEWIRRDEFVHYLTLAHELGHPSDWSTFRRELLAAVTAAFGTDQGLGQVGAVDRMAVRTLQLLDETRRRHDPSTNWSAFLEALWALRHAIRRYP